jgi:Nif-specific regulatory protein
MWVEVLSGERAGQRIRLSLPAAVGREATGELVLADAHLSTRHGRLRWFEGAVRFADLSSSNGTRHVRGEDRTALVGADAEAELWDGDVLELGDAAHPVRLRVILDADAAADAASVLAERPLAEIDRFADRVEAEPARLRVLYRHLQRLGASTDLEAVLGVAAGLVFELLPRATHLAVALAEQAGRFPVVFAQDRDGGKPTVAISRTLMQRVVSGRVGVLLTDAADQLGGARSAVQAGLQSTLAVPLYTGDVVRGVLQVDNRDAPGLFGADDLEALAVAAGPLAFAIQNARLFAQLQHAEARLDRENRYLKAKAQAEVPHGILGDSPAMAAVVQAIERVRDTRVPVLITGETGTGKELVARAIHYTSKRREALLVAQNCATLPEHLLESELFGHVRGAFTGADRDKKGLFELADGGTIFLDEIGEMPLMLQAKLLRVLQEGEVVPVGAGRPRKVDVRVVSATHRDVEAMVRGGAFREDLYYRLHVYPIRLPPLRERPGDIPLLARHFLGRYAQDFGRAVTGFAPETLDRLRAWHWPGNVRELQNELQRALIGRTEGDVLLAEDLSPRVAGSAGYEAGAGVPDGQLKDMLASAEKVLLERALSAHGGNKTRAAQALGITREGLHKKLARFGVS